MNEVKLGAIADLISSNVDKKSRDDETPVRLVNYTDVYYGSVLNSDHDFMEATASSQQIERVGLRHGDVIFTKDSESPDDIGIPAIANSPDGDMICGYHLTIARPHPEFVFSKYLYWYLNSAQAKRHWEQTANGVTRFSIGFSATSALPVYLPPLPTQRAIADYLDRETAEIDGMRADLDEMERLLEERRESLFSSIVGNEDTEVRVGVTSLLITGSTPKGGRLGAKDRPEKGLLWLRPEDLDEKRPTRAIKLTPAESETVKTLPANTPLFCGIGATVGKTGFANQRCATNQQITALVPQHGFDARYLFRALQAKQNEIRETAPSSTLKIVNNQRLGAQKIPYASYAEQRRIADEIDRETAEIDSMLEDITKLRDLLVERRAAVISAAVTGQIDIPASLDDKDEPHA
ncbi:restriction endonuclease subunit S [Corynebacterium confusum]|uniref:restriction endonuclease subunit S n=1 Tax=Corynebacterium confusum TaxID=71254 RepID=UPI0025B32735|nr:restriction endonuclease subunit S [Corynebacterium confusum]WJY89697.1 Restriction-modification system protein HsdS [Corynebacterium confusum]